MWDLTDWWMYEGTAVYATDQALIPTCPADMLNPPRLPNRIYPHDCRAPNIHERDSELRLADSKATAPLFKEPWTGMTRDNRKEAGTGPAYSSVLFWYYVQAHLQVQSGAPDKDVIKHLWKATGGDDNDLENWARARFPDGLEMLYHQYMIDNYLRTLSAPSVALDNPYFESYKHWQQDAQASPWQTPHWYVQNDATVSFDSDDIMTPTLTLPRSRSGDDGKKPIDYLGTRYYAIDIDPSLPVTSTLEISFLPTSNFNNSYLVSYLHVTTPDNSLVPLAVHDAVLGPNGEAGNIYQVTNLNTHASSGQRERVIVVVSKATEIPTEYKISAHILGGGGTNQDTQPIANPNPFSPNDDGRDDTTTISYKLPPDATFYNVTFLLSDPDKPEITLGQETQGPGDQHWVWNVTPEVRQQLGPGTHTIRMIAGESPDGINTYINHLYSTTVKVDLTSPPNVLNLRVVKGAAGSTLTWTSVATDTTSTATYRVYSDTRPITDIAAATEYSTVAAPTTSLAIPRTTDDRYYAVLAEDEAGNRSAPEMVDVPGQKMDVIVTLPRKFCYENGTTWWAAGCDFYQSDFVTRLINSLPDGDRIGIVSTSNPSLINDIPLTELNSTSRNDLISKMMKIKNDPPYDQTVFYDGNTFDKTVDGIISASNKFNTGDNRKHIIIHADNYTTCPGNLLSCSGDLYKLESVYDKHITLFYTHTEVAAYSDVPYSIREPDDFTRRMAEIQSIIDASNAHGAVGSQMFPADTDGEQAYHAVINARYPMSDVDTETVDPGKTETIPYLIDSTMSEAMIRLTWDPAGRPPRITLHPPKGKGEKITPDALPAGAFYEEEAGTATYRLELPPLPHGQWTIEVANPNGGEASRSAVAAAQKSQNAAGEPITFTIERAANTNLAVSLSKSDSRTLDLTALQDGAPLSDNTAAWVELQSATGVTSTVVMQASSTPGHYTGDVDPLLGTGLFTATVSLRSYDPQNGYIERTFQRNILFGTPSLAMNQTQWDDALNHDWQIDPGDRISLTTWIRNDGTDVASTITGTLELVSGDAQVVNGTAAYPRLLASQTVTNTIPYSIQLSPTIPTGTAIKFIQRIWWDGTAVLTTPLSLQIGAPEITRRSVRWVDRNHEDGRVDPGDTVDLMVDIANQGDGTATSIRGTLSPLDTATHVLSDTASYSALNPGEQATNHTAYTFTVDPATPPGTILQFQHVISAGRTFTDTFNVPVGISQFGDAQHYTATDMPMEIPDDERNSAESGISVEDDRPVGDVNVTVNLTHPLAEQLSLTLVSPQGSHIPLVNQTDAIGANFRDTTFNDQAASALVGAPAPFTGVFRPDAPLAVLNGESASGSWYLVATDTISGTTGTLDSWSLDMRPIVPVCWPQGNDTCIPTATISPTSTEVIEGLGSTTLVTFTVTLDRPSLLPVRIGYTTVNGTATGTLSPYDYTPTQGTLQFSPGETEKTIKIRVINDTTEEPDETFSLRLQNPVQAVLGAPEAKVTILDDDTINRVNFWGSSLPTVQEGNTITASIRLTTPARKPISVSYTTKDGTAKAPGDYTAQSGTVTFAIGQQQQDVSISTIADGQTEPSEDFTLELNNAVNATIGSTPSTRATIDASNCADSFEPDNDIAHAQPITTGQPQQHTFCSRLDVDWSRFEATTGITYWIETQYNNPDGFTTLQLYADDGSTILADSYATGPNGAKQLKWQAPTAGTFYLRTTHSSVTTPTETYVLQILPMDGPTPVSSNEPCVDDYEPNNTWMQAQAIDMTSGYYFQEQAFCIAGDEDWFHIDASAGIPYIFQTTESSAYVDPIIEVYDSNNLLVASNDDTSRFDSEVQFIPEVSGSYFVKIHHANPSWGDPSFTYNIWFTTWW